MRVTRYIYGYSYYGNYSWDWGRFSARDETDTVSALGLLPRIKGRGMESVLAPGRVERTRDQKEVDSLRSVCCGANIPLDFADTVSVTRKQPTERSSNVHHPWVIRVSDSLVTTTKLINKRDCERRYVHFRYTYILPTVRLIRRWYILTRTRSVDFNSLATFHLRLWDLVRFYRGRLLVTWNNEWANFLETPIEKVRIAKSVHTRSRGPAHTLSRIQCDAQMDRIKISIYQSSRARNYTSLQIHLLRLILWAIVNAIIFNDICALIYTERNNL